MREFTELSEQALDRIEGLVSSLLKVAKLDAGSVAIEKRYETIAEIMEDVRRHFAFWAEREKKLLTLSGAKDVLLLCDRQ